MPFKFSCLEIPDVILVEPEFFIDRRGLFMETYKYSDFLKAGIKEYFVQDNYSKSTRNVLRGLHYQKNPDAQGKLVKCLRGLIFDVAVDIRVGSPNYGRWVGYELSEDNNLMLYIPPGFAHGFISLSESAEVTYKCTKEYSPVNERGIIWNDPDIGIRWPIEDPIISDNDRGYPRLRDADNNFRYGFNL